MTNLISGGFGRTWPPNYGPLAEIQSFTYEDSLTHTDILAAMKHYIKFVLVPYLQNVVGELNEINQELIADVTAKLEAQMAEVEAKLDAQDAENDAKIAALTQYVNEQVQLIIEDSIQVQDPVVAALLNDPDSATRVAADAIYGNKYELPILYSKEHGVVGDGTDQAANIEALLALAKTRGAKVVMESGVTFTVNRPVIFNGVPWDLNGCTLLAGANITSIIVSPGFYEGGATIFGGKIENGNFDMATKAHSAFWLMKVENVVITRNSIKNPILTSSSMIRLNQNTVNCEVSWNTLVNPLDDPISTYPSMSGISCTSDVVDPQSGGQNATLTFQDPTNLSRLHRIFKNKIRGGTHGISLYGAEECTVEDNYLDNFGHRGIILSPRARFNKILNNTVYDFGSTGIHLAWGCTSNVITGNILRTTRSATEGDGIKGYFGCSDNLVADNLISGVTGSASGAAIRFAVGSTRNMIVANKINNCTTGIRIDSKLGGAYYNPASAPGTAGTVIASNIIVGIAGSKGIMLVTYETTQITRTTINGNSLIFCAVGFEFIEATGSIATTAASNNNIDATDKFISPRVAAHFVSAYGNEGIPDVVRAPFMQISESSEPIQPATSDARLFVDTSGGKKRLMVRFATGASQQIAIQP